MKELCNKPKNVYFSVIRREDPKIFGSPKILYGRSETRYYASILFQFDKSPSYYSFDTARNRTAFIMGVIKERELD